MATIDHFSGKVGVKAIIMKDDKVLITRSLGDALWDFPGGRIDTGEALEDAVRREIREELGVDIRVEKMICSEQTLHVKDNAHILFVTFLATLDDPAAAFSNPDNEAEETRWISKEDFPSIKLFAQCIKPLKTVWNIA